MILLRKNQFLIIDSTDGDKSSDIDWFDKHIDIEITGGDNNGSFIVVDFSLSKSTEIKYTIDGKHYESFDGGAPLHSGRRFIPVYNG